MTPVQNGFKEGKSGSGQTSYEYRRLWVGNGGPWDYGSGRGGGEQ